MEDEMARTNPTIRLAELQEKLTRGGPSWASAKMVERESDCAACGSATVGDPEAQAGMCGTCVAVATGQENGY